MKKAALFAALLASIGVFVSMCPPDVPPAQRLATLVPATIGPWLSDAAEIYGPESIFGYIDGAGEVYRAYNMRLLLARRFHKDGRPDIVVDAFDMGSSADAYGVFTHDLDGEDAAMGQGSTYKAGLLSFWKDRYFVSVYAEEETPETRAAVLELGREIDAAIPGRGEIPALVGRLPGEGLEKRTVRFFHTASILNYFYFVAEENILLLDRETDAVLAEYGGPAGRSRLLLVSYPQANGAARAAESFRRAYRPDAAGKEAAGTENGKWTAVRTAGRTVVVCFDAGSAEEAAARLDALEKRLKERTP
jgi:Family of unknown function (DUF6599)